MELAEQQSSASLKGVRMTKKAGELNREKFIAWVDEMKSQDSPDWNRFFYNGKLSPAAVAAEIKIGKDAFKIKNNPKLRELFDRLQDELSESGIYHKRNSRLKVEEVVEKQPSENEEEVTDSAKIRDLKRANRRLQNENAKLAAEIAKLSEFKEVLVEMNLWK